MFCVNCGAQLDGDERFCTKCGQPVVAPAPMRSPLSAAAYRAQPMYRRPYYGRQIPKTKSTLDSIIDNVNRMTGGTEHIDLKMKDLVENVFKKHTKAEAEEIFIYGTAATTPPFHR